MCRCVYKGRFLKKKKIELLEKYVWICYKDSRFYLWFCYKLEKYLALQNILVSAPLCEVSSFPIVMYSTTYLSTQVALVTVKLGDCLFIICCNISLLVTT